MAGLLRAISERLLIQIVAAHSADCGPEFCLIFATSWAAMSQNSYVTGVALWRELKNHKIASFCLKPDGDKAERLAVACDRFYSGEIELPRNELWSETVFRQFRAFPDGHDDVLDTITQFVAWLRTLSMPKVFQIKKHGRISNPARRASGW